MYIMDVHGKMEKKGKICQPQILISLLLSPRGSQTTEADFKNILFKTKT